jgi:membrane-associated HD superfamily phosphohydrolase
MEPKDLLLLLHPTLAVVVVFPSIGIVIHRALQVRKQRLRVGKGDKSSIAPSAAQEHVKTGIFLTSFVVAIVLLAFAHGIFSKANADQSKFPLLICLFIATLASLVCLSRASNKLWRGIFATLTGIGLVVLGFQDGIYRKDNQWYFSHFYYGLAATLLLVFSLAILPSIYQDRTNRWRTVHILLNVFVVLLFAGQGLTGSLSLLEIPLNWQKPYVNKLYEQKCSKRPCVVQPANP